jgi:LPXTG-motif cell wall-anchored protein
LQDGVLFMIGGAAILFGAGSFFYRKKLTKDR